MFLRLFLDDGYRPGVGNYDLGSVARAILSLPEAAVSSSKSPPQHVV
jgi:hypothetical protein